MKQSYIDIMNALDNLSPGFWGDTAQALAGSRKIISDRLHLSSIHTSEYVLLI